MNGVSFRESREGNLFACLLEEKRKVYGNYLGTDCIDLGLDL